MIEPARAGAAAASSASAAQLEAVTGEAKRTSLLRYFHQGHRARREGVVHIVATGAFQAAIVEHDLGDGSSARLGAGTDRDDPRVRIEQRLLQHRELRIVEQARG